MDTRLRVCAFAVLCGTLCWSAPSLAARPSSPPPLYEVPDRVPEPETRVQADAVCSAAGTEQQVVILVNDERLANGGLPPLKQVSELNAAAGGHSQAMAERDFFAHCDPDTGKSPWVRMTDAGYQWSGAAENIAAGYTSPATVMTGWMGSSGHRANILDASLREIGVGYFLQTDDDELTRTDADNDCTTDGILGFRAYRYWTQNFGRRNTVYPLVIDREATVTVTREVDLYVYGSGWATEMRLRNDSDAWSAWQPFATQLSWQLPKGNGDHTVAVQLRNAAGTTREAEDAICLDVPTVPPAEVLLRNGFE